MSEVSPPYRSGFAAGLGVVLAAGLALALVDVVHTGDGALAVLGLWALVMLPAALGIGLVLGAGNASWGNGWVRGLFRKLRTDDELDRKISASLIAAALVGGVLALVIAKLSMGLVADVQRKSIGALLLGVVVVAVIPVIALGALPLYRAIRFAGAVHLAIFPAIAAGLGGVALWLTRTPILAALVFALAWVVRIPPIGPLSRVVVLVVGAVGGAVLAAAAIIYSQLDYQSLNLGSLIAPALLPVLAIGIGLVAYGPLAGVRERIPARGAIALGVAVLVAAFPVIGLRGTPSPEARTAVVDRSYLGSRAIPMLRKVFDRDRDTYSAFFGGPDCDDGDADVHPGATEVAENGKDDNCVGGDGKREVVDRIPVAPVATTLTGGTNVVVIFVDTLRHDRLGIAGYKRDDKSLTPRLDAFAKQSVMFTHAYAQAPNTPRSVPSFLSSRYPTQLALEPPIKGCKVCANYRTVKDEGNEFLFEVMKPAGFKTIGMTSHFYFCDRVRAPDTCKTVASWMTTNVQQGADEWDNTEAVDIGPSNRDIAGPRTVKKTVARLEQLAKDKTKFAMLVHLFEPHSTYVEHDDYPITETTNNGKLIQRYDYEIAVVDKRIGELLDALDTTGLAKTTTVVVLSDHGEAFGVHAKGGKAMFFHGQTLYRELIHVPLMFRVPGVAARETGDVVMLLDLAPTIAALFGVAPPASWQGRSLVPALEGKPLDPKPAFGELVSVPDWEYESRSMITPDNKRHVLFDLTDWEIFDLEADPDERKNLVKSDPDADKLKEQVTRWIERPTGGK